MSYFAEMTLFRSVKHDLVNDLLVFYRGHIYFCPLVQVYWCENCLLEFCNWIWGPAATLSPSNPTRRLEWDAACFFIWTKSLWVPACWQRKLLYSYFWKNGHKFICATFRSSVSVVMLSYLFNETYIFYMLLEVQVHLRFFFVLN